MTVTEMFEQFLDNLSIDNKEQISGRYEEITRCLNQKYRDTDSKTANSLQAGSYGRRTAIRGVSDLDMIYIMPQSTWDRFNKSGGQSALLQDVKGALKERYPKTEMKADGQVVVVSFGNNDIEVVPAYEESDGSFKYPDTNNGGSWKITKPREEKSEISRLDTLKNYNLKPLCKMARAWKNKHGVVMGGLLIDTLAYNFLNSTNEYDNKGYLYYDYMSRDFFKYLSEQEDQARYSAPGSGQHVHVKKKFQKKAKKAYELCLAAIAANGQANENEKWKKVYGRPFPGGQALRAAATADSVASWRNTEEHIEDKYQIDIRYNLEIDCDVTQDGFPKSTLRDLIRRNIWLRPQKKLRFHVSEIDVPEPFTLMWKVLNRGERAKELDQVRGQIVADGGYRKKDESTSFRGEHIVECYAIRNGVVVAKTRILVPIE